MTTSYSSGHNPNFTNFDWTGTGRGNHVDFDRSQTVPLIPGRFLGQGINGPIYETTCQGRVFAWKQKYCRNKVTEKDLKELKLLKRLDHHHIIKIGGSYTHQRFLGLLLFPVAVCDLGDLLDDVEKLDSVVHGALLENDSWERIKALDMGYTHYTPTHVLASLRWKLRGYMVCIMSAIVYLHQCSIRHKDLKPANILLTPEKLLVTDFGTSTDFSLLTTSATNNGERGTPKYFAPEVARYQPSGRAADIFSLGCVLLEINSALDFGLQLKLRTSRSDADRSFQANMPAVKAFISSLMATSQPQFFPKFESMIRLLDSMISEDPADRPTSAEASEVMRRTANNLLRTCHCK